MPPEAGRGLTAYHGTDIVSARGLLRGEPLNTAEAMARKIDGPPGFFLATEVDDAIFFALRRAPGGVLEYRLSSNAVEQLRVAGAVCRPIPPGKAIRFLGNEFYIPLEAFDLFNQLRAAGEIAIVPASGV